MQQAIELTQFNALTTSDKYTILEENGIYLDLHRLQGAYKIALFELNGYYVEVWLNRVADLLYKAEAFNEYERLDPYLLAIDLSSIHNLLY